MRNTLLLLLLWCSAEAQLVNDKYWKWVKTDQKNCKYFAQNTFNDASHATWTGGCRDGLADGEGELKVFYGGKGYLSYTYTGSLTLGKLTGKGKLMQSAESFEKGIFVDGELINGSKSDFLGYYEGEFKNKKLNGKGFKIDSDSAMHIGTFKDDDLIDKGLVIYKNGDTLRGTFTEYGYVNNADYVYKADGAIFKGKHGYKYKPLYGEIYLNGLKVAKVEDGVRLPLNSSGIPMGKDMYYGPERRDVNGVLQPNGNGKIVFENKDTLYATFRNGKVEKELNYITVNGYRFDGYYKDNKPYSGKFYRGSEFGYEILYGNRRERSAEDVASETKSGSSYPEGQYNPWNSYTKPKPGGSSSSSSSSTIETTTDPYAGYAKGVLVYKGISDYDLVIEVQAEARYLVKKSPGALSFNYIDVAEAKGVRFRYPGNSSTWYNFDGYATIYPCKDGFNCISVQGMVFKLTAPYLP